MSNRIQVGRHGIASNYRGAEQVFSVGYDTVQRIVDPKYYAPPAVGMEVSLAPFFERAELVVSLRGGGRRAQRSSMERDGDVGAVLARWGWWSRVVVVGAVDGDDDGDDGGDDGDGISSSAVRSGIRDARLEVLKALGGPVREWVWRCGLYRGAA